jgi:hypothetical protein
MGFAQVGLRTQGALECLFREASAFRSSIEQADPLNFGILALAILMLGTGIAALRRPSLGALLSEAIVSALLLCWNIGITVLNLRAGIPGAEGHGLILQAIAAAVFFRQYKRLGHLKEAIAVLDNAKLKEASGLCKQLFKTKLKHSPDVAESSGRRCRLRLMSDSVFGAQRNLTRAFHMTRPIFQQCIPDLSKRRLRIVVRHPLGKIIYVFDRKNSEKIKGWLNQTSMQPS